MKKIRTAVIDVGTLKSKFEIREYDKNLNSKVVTRKKELTVLGRDLDKNNGKITEKAKETTISALIKFKELIEKYQVEKYKAVTTEAIRKATNSKEVLKEIKRKAGITLDTLSHKDEAEIYFLSVSKDFPGQTIAVSDVGGGSVQVVVGKDKQMFETYLFKTGTYFLQEEFSSSHHPSKTEIQNVKDYIEKELEVLKKCKYIPDVLIYGSTNIIDFFQAMNIQLDKWSDHGDHRFSVSVDKLYPVYERIIKLSYEDRMPLYEDEPYYMWSADNALLNIFRISENLKVDTIIPSNSNLSSGILYNLAESLFTSKAR